jgi:hypothetical protein
MLGDVLPMVGQTWPTMLDSNPVLKTKREFLISLENSLTSLGKSLDVLQKHRLGKVFINHRNVDGNV